MANGNTITVPRATEVMLDYEPGLNMYFVHVWNSNPYDGAVGRPISFSHTATLKNDEPDFAPAGIRREEEEEQYLYFKALPAARLNLP